MDPDPAAQRGEGAGAPVGGMPPAQVLGWLAEGLRQQAEHNFSGAALAYRRVLRSEPDQVDALCNLGVCYRELGRFEEALESTERALVLDPRNLAALCNKGALLAEARRFEQALALLQAVLEREPGSYQGRFQKAGILYRLGRWEEALEVERTVVASAPESGAALSNLGLVLMRLGRMAEAREVLERALALNPDSPSARWNFAYLNLLEGRWEEAWPHFACRLQVREGLANIRNFELPEWQGEPFPGRRLLLWAEQGFGDTVQFLRFLPEVKALGGELVLQVQTALLPLLRGIPGVDRLLGEHEPLPPVDLHASLLSLLPKLRLTPARVEAVPPLLELPAGYAPPEELRIVVGAAGERVRIALAWTGNPAHWDQGFRSADPDVFAPLAALPGVAWFDCQKYAPGLDPRPLPREMNAVRLAPVLPTFAETAWALQRMHLVITVDTSVAHLAGSLGVPTFLLLPFGPDWRWLQEGESTPWYPTFRIYRQKRLGDWAEVIDRVLSDLQSTP